MIDQLTIENYKCFAKRTDIKLAPITLLYGENSGGKSTVLQALDVLRNIHLGIRGSECPSFPFQDVVAGKDLDKKIRIGLWDSSDYVFRMWSNGQPPPEWDLFRDHYGLEWSTTLAWNKSKHQAEVFEVYIHCPSGFPNEAFIEFGTMLQISKKLPQELVEKADKLLHDSTDELKEGLKRLVEFTIMKEYFQEDTKENKEYFDLFSLASTIFSSEIHGLEGKDRVRSLSPEEIRALEQKQEKRERASELLESWREGLPEWIKDCPSGWREYRSSKEYAEKADSLLSNRFRELKEFCEEPNVEKLDNVLIQVSFPDNSLASCQVTGKSFIDELKKVAGDHHMCVDLVYDPNRDFEHEGEFEPNSISVEFSPRSLHSPLADLTQEHESAVKRMVDDVRDFFSESLENGRRLVQSLVLISPFREQPKRIYSFAEEVYTIAGILAENKNDICGQVNAWLKKLGIDYEVDIHRLDAEGYFQILLMDARNLNQPPVNYADVGYGISQVLPVLTAGLSGENSVILVDEPEQHIHPRLQAELGTFLAECMKTRRHQFIVATHSEHLMLRIQRLIREKKLYGHQVALRYVVRGESGSEVQSLELNENGEFAGGWPEGFMPDRLEELI